MPSTQPLWQPPHGIITMQSRAEVTGPGQVPIRSHTFGQTKIKCERGDSKDPFGFFLLYHFWSLRFWKLIQAGKTLPGQNLELTERQRATLEGGRFGVSPSFQQRVNLQGKELLQRGSSYTETVPWLFFHRR